MDLLAVVEEQLGSIETWPTRALTNLFNREPAVSVTRRVAAFLYGSGFKLSEAVNFYKASNRVCVEKVIYLLTYSMVQSPSSEASWNCS